MNHTALADPPEFFNYAHDVIEKARIHWASRLALVEVAAGATRRYSFEEMDQQSSRIAHILSSIPILHQDKIMIATQGETERLLAFIATMKVGAISFVANQRNTAAELRHYTERIQPTLVITSGNRSLEAPSEIPHLVLDAPEIRTQLMDVPDWFTSVTTRGDALAQIRSTSGSTGIPKLVLHSNVSRFYYQGWGRGIQPDDLLWDASTTEWIAAWRTGAAVLVHERNPQVDPSSVLPTIAEHGVTFLVANATTYEQALRAGNDVQVPTLRRCWARGQALPERIAEAWYERTGVWIDESYSQAEIGGQPFVRPPNTSWRPGCLGIPAPFLDVAIVGSKGEKLPAGHPGEIAVRVLPHRPAALFKGYLDTPEQFREKHIGEWYLTGDRGVVGPEGLFWLLGRRDEVITTQGFNVDPVEVESVLANHPFVSEVAVIGETDNTWGEVPVAFVVLNHHEGSTSNTTDTLRKHVAEQLHPLKQPHRYHFLDHMPRTATGKVARAMLKGLLA